ncbi:MAG: hypothetical protein CMJ48_06135 [Planctomycetaceae bacterium]|nr:hypothetical protein [Planctomycetaceae bacterium]
MSITSAGNTYNPALVILDEKGYSLRVELGHDYTIWCAEKDGHHFSGSNPLELLAVASIFERFGDSWQDAIRNPDLLEAVFDAAELPDDDPNQ